MEENQICENCGQTKESHYIDPLMGSRENPDLCCEYAGEGGKKFKPKTTQNYACVGGVAGCGNCAICKKEI